MAAVICENFLVCGRYKPSRRKQIVGQHFDSASDAEDWNPRFNVAPAQPVPVIRQHPKELVREFSLMLFTALLTPIQQDCDDPTNQTFSFQYPRREAFLTFCSPSRRFNAVPTLSRRFRSCAAKSFSPTTTSPDG
jgi:hypothetical protein